MFVQSLNSIYATEYCNEGNQPVKICFWKICRVLESMNPMWLTKMAAKHANPIYLQL